MKISRLAVAAALVLALAACGREGSDDETQEATAKVPTAPVAPAAIPPPAPVMPKAQIPTTVAADAVTVGNAMQGDVAVKSVAAQFSTGDTVYASASVRGKPAGADASVYWTYQDGNAHKQETKKLSGQQTIWFSFTKADGMKPGKYNVEIDVDMKPVGIADFQIK